MTLGVDDGVGVRASGVYRRSDGRLGVDFALPRAVDPEDVRVSLKDSRLCVAADYSVKRDDDDAAAEHSGSFRSCFSLPRGVEKVDAAFEHGAVRVAFERVEPADAPPRRKIDVEYG